MARLSAYFLPMPQTFYGGQAVIEGVMMRGPSAAAVAVRNRQGTIVVRREDLSSPTRRVASLPFVRGLVQLREMLVLGTRMLLYSAAVQAGTSDQEMPRGVLVIVMISSLAFALGLFFVLPLLVARGPLPAPVEGVVRLAIFLGYLALIRRFPRVRRVFQYHGAEHKTINAFEAGAALTPAHVQSFSTAHTRCGTAFLLWVVVLSAIAFSVVNPPSLVLAIVARIILIPLIAAIGYEMLRLGTRYYGVPAVRLLVQPSLWLQSLTTAEPDDDQVETAIVALRAVLADGVSVR
ncbi:MAG TPA: DUF1385 domain-containing protein [Chloroflexota bacterium]|nr:DUF1385 domain-containing protein [Chloroflexota bacterium]